MFFIRARGWDWMNSKTQTRPMVTTMVSLEATLKQRPPGGQVGALPCLAAPQAVFTVS